MSNDIENPRPRQWTILLSSSHRGVVGPYGHAFEHAEAKHVHVNVVDEEVCKELSVKVEQLQAEVENCRCRAQGGNTNKSGCKNCLGIGECPMCGNTSEEASVSHAAQVEAAGVPAIVQQWKDAYAAFVGAFDTPQMRRQMSDDYSNDARVRLRYFNDAMLAAAPSAPATAQAPAELTDEPNFYDEVTKALGLLKQDYSADCLKMASTPEYVEDAVAQLISAGYRLSTPAASAQAQADVRDAALEEAAKVAERCYAKSAISFELGTEAAKQIRALKSSASSEVGAQAGRKGGSDE